MLRGLLFLSLQMLFTLNAYSTELNFAVIGDAGRLNNNSDMILNSISRSGIKNLVLPGDNLYESDYAAVWNPWIEAGFNFSVVAIGNHNRGYDREMKFFNMPREFYSKNFGELVRFIVLNSDNQHTAKEQAQFLEEQLSRATERFVFVVYHHPSYTVSNRHDWEEKKEFQLAVRPVLFNHSEKITALLLGHDHLALLAHFDSIPVIVSGATGQIRRDRPVNNVQSGVSVSTDWFFDEKAYWVSIELGNEKQLAKIQYIKASNDKVSCTAFIATGQKAQMSDNCSLNQ